MACISLIANIIPLLTCRKKGARGKWYVVECELLSGHYWRLLLCLVLVRLVEGEEERVGHAFAGDVGAWAVARDDGHRGVWGGFVGGRLDVQWEELPEDAFHEHLVVAAGVVGAADGAGEEGVAAEENLFGRFIEGNAARSVARGLDDLETEPADLDDGDAFRAIRTVGAAARRTQTFGTMGAIRTIGAAGRRCIGAAFGWITGMAIGRTICTAIATTVGAALGRTISTTLRRAGLADIRSLERSRKRSAEPFGEIFISGEGRFVGRVHVYRERAGSAGIAGRRSDRTGVIGRNRN